ncbi:MAG: pentapeptide repeat-containing protein [Tepidisphaeraceae bacterium]
MRRSIRRQCASVMARVRAAPHREELRGLPELWVIVLEELAGDDSLMDIRTALRRRLTRGLADPEVYVRAVQACEESLRGLTDSDEVWDGAPPGEVSGLLRHRIMAVLLGSEKLAADVAGSRFDGLGFRLPRDLIRETARLLKTRSGALERLADRLERKQSIQAMGVSVLLAADPGWHPGGKKLTHLGGARLGGACWPHVDLSGCKLLDADLRGADLSAASLDHAMLPGANLRNAVLRKARLVGIDATGADFSSADLSGADATDAVFTHAGLAEASLTDALLRDASLHRTKLMRARLTRADLSGAVLGQIEIEDADLRNADFSGASFHMGSSRSGLVGSTIASEGTRTGFYTDDFGDQDFKATEEIRKANLCGCDLRGAKVEGTDFYLVDLRRATYTPDQARHFAACGAILHARG